MLSVPLVLSLLSGCSSDKFFEDECTSQAGCPEGKICVAGFCLAVSPVVTECSESRPCARGVCEDGKCVPPCNGDVDCNSGVCESNRCVPQCNTEGTQDSCDVGLCKNNRCVPQCYGDVDCSVSEICEKARCELSQCDKEGERCDNGHCDGSRRCVPQCKDNGDCNNQACVKGVCEAFKCPACDRTQACVDAGIASDPAQGKCEKVQCNDAPDNCRLGICVNAENPDNPLKGACRGPCNTGATDTCIISNKGVCVSLGKPGTSNDGTCEPVVCAPDCRKGTQFCKSVGISDNPTAGQCVDAVCDAPCSRAEFCASTGILSAPTAGKCEAVQCKDEAGVDICHPTDERCVRANNPTTPTKGECRTGCSIPNPANNNPCGPGMTCVGIEQQVDGKVGTCEEGCFRVKDCDTGKTCKGASPTTLTPGTCEEGCFEDNDCTAGKLCQGATATTPGSCE